jgi:hypothetical protein
MSQQLDNRVQAEPKTIIAQIYIKTITAQMQIETLISQMHVWKSSTFGGKTCHLSYAGMTMTHHQQPSTWSVYVPCITELFT